MAFFGFDQSLSFPTAGKGDDDSGNEIVNDFAYRCFFCNQSLERQITILQCTIAGGRTKGANEGIFGFVYQHGGDERHVKTTN